MAPHRSKNGRFERRPAGREDRGTKQRGTGQEGADDVAQPSAPPKGLAKRHGKAAAAKAAKTSVGIASEDGTGARAESTPEREIDHEAVYILYARRTDYSKSSPKAWQYWVQNIPVAKWRYDKPSFAMVGTQADGKCKGLTTDFWGHICRRGGRSRSALAALFVEGDSVEVAPDWAEEKYNAAVLAGRGPAVAPPPESFEKENYWSVLTGP